MWQADKVKTSLADTVMIWFWGMLNTAVLKGYYIFQVQNWGIRTKTGRRQSYLLSTNNSGGDEVIFSPTTTGVVTKLISLHQQLWWKQSYLLSTNN